MNYELAYITLLILTSALVVLMANNNKPKY